jgi:single-strand DNA-binding protein
MALPTVSIFGTINKKELKYLPNGKALCSYKIECSEKNAKGEWDNLYIDGVSFDKQAEFVNQYFNDGDLCIATGKLVTEVYENKEGKKVYTIKLKFPNIEFAPKSKNSAPQPKQAPKVETYNAQGKKTAEYDMPEIDISEDMIPF